METETLSSYAQPQDKHVLDANTDINIPRSDEESDLVQTKEINVVDSGTDLKEINHDDSERLKVNHEPSENKENENNVTNNIDHSENEISSDNETESEEESVHNENETVEGEETNKSFDKTSNEDGSNKSIDSSLSDDERDLLDSDEKDPLDDEGKDSSNDEEKSLVSSEENSPLNDEVKSPVDNEENSSLIDEEKTKSSLSDGETDPLSVEKDPLSIEEKDPLSHEEKEPLESDEPKTPTDLTDNADNTERDLLNSKEDQKNDVPHNDKEQKFLEEKNKSTVDDESKESSTSTDDHNKSEKPSSPVENLNESKDPLKEKNENKDEALITEKKETIEKEAEDQCDKGEVKSEKQKEIKGTSEEDEKNSPRDISKDCPLLKETLTKPRNDDGEQSKEADGETGMDDIEMDDDFDPSLLCPDIAMEVDEAPVITNNDNAPSDGNKSPCLYESVFSTYVDEMTGAEVSFNLTPEEQQLRQESFGEGNPVQYTRIHCTACNVHLGSALDAQSNRFVHPLLKVLICKDCYHFYTSGEFEKDEDGSELYCRWCGQGGQVICCSSCEMVFCKKCIRINFGRKKLTEIRDAEEWLCFRCDTLQLAALRIHCAEFMEYVRREISRAATLENATSFTTTDYTQCCISQKKKYVEPHPSEPKKKKRKASINDPDYDPIADRPSPPPTTTSTNTTTILITPAVTDAHISTQVTPQKPVPILPKPMDPNHNAGIVTQIGQNNQVFKVGNTTFRPRVSQFSQPRPRVQVINPVTTSQVVRVPSSGPGYIKIMPGGIRVPPSPTRTQPAQTYVSASVRPQPPYQQRPPRPLGAANSQMKHEWFEKTVRAAARVNSNLSYTLTQLNRAQATATSVEALAVVHNKLQEILSTSINSLIQIRKNLRTEFIAGIKNIRFPPKPPQPQPSTSSQDDDVIFVSPTPSPVPPPLMQSPVVTHLPSLTLPPAVSLTKRLPTGLGPSTSSDPVPGTSRDVFNDKPKVFLRVKSLTALQNVPSECITIPDDPLPPPPPLTPIRKEPEEVTVIESSPEKNDVGIIIKDVTSILEDPLQINMDKGYTEIATNITNGNRDDKNSNDGEELRNEFQTKFNLKDTPPHELKKMMNIRVYITRSEEIDKLVKSTFGLVNGNTTE